jgi:hypothetical protein
LNGWTDNFTYNADVDARVIILLSRGTFCDGRRGGDKCQSTEEARQTARQVLGDIWRCRFLMVDRRLFVVVIDTIEGQVVVVHIIWEAIIIKRIFTSSLRLIVLIIWYVGERVSSPEEGHDEGDGRGANRWMDRYITRAGILTKTNG